MTSTTGRSSSAAQGSELDWAGHSSAGTADPDLFARHWVTVEQAIRGVCRRHRFTADDAEDFTSMVCVRLLEDECAVLRRFGGRSTLGTYLTAVITHLAQDWRNARWGKWRPSMAARRGGPVAVHLDRLLQRDGFSFDEACETLRTNYQVSQSRSELEAIAATLPVRIRRRFVEWSALEYEDAWVAEDPRSDPFLPGRAQLLTRVLTDGLRALSAEERLLVKLRFEDGLRIVDIARTLCQPEKPLYRRLERVMLKLRREFERRGLRGDSLQELLDHDGASVADGALRAAFVGVDSWAVAPDAVN